MLATAQELFQRSNEPSASAARDGASHSPLASLRRTVAEMNRPDDASSPSGLTQSVRDFVERATLPTATASRVHSISRELSSLLSRNSVRGRNLLDELRDEQGESQRPVPGRAPPFAQDLLSIRTDANRSKEESASALADTSAALEACEAAIQTLADDNRVLAEELSRQRAETAAGEDARITAAENERDKWKAAYEDAVRREGDTRSDLDEAYQALESARAAQEDLRRATTSQRRRIAELEQQLHAAHRDLSAALEREADLRERVGHIDAAASTVNRMNESPVPTRDVKDDPPRAPLADGSPAKLTPVRQRNSPGRAAATPRHTAQSVLANAKHLLSAVSEKRSTRAESHTDIVDRAQRRRSMVREVLSGNSPGPAVRSPAAVVPGISSSMVAELEEVVRDTPRGRSVSTPDVATLRDQLAALDREEAALHEQQRLILQKRSAVSSTLMAQRNQKLMNGAPDTDVEQLNNQISAVMAKIDAATTQVDSNLEFLRAKRRSLARKLRLLETQR